MGICCFFAVFLSLRCPFQGLALRPMLLARPPPAPSVSCRTPPCNPAAPFEKGVDPKTFLRMGNILSMEGQRTRNAGAIDFREPIYGHRAPPPLWVFCALVHGGRHRRKPLGFRRCLPPARPEKAKPFQAGRSPCTKHQQTVRLCLYAPKKVFEGSKGRFFKNAPLAGCGTASHKRRTSHHRDAPFQAGQSPCTKHPRLSGIAFTHLKSF